MKDEFMAKTSHTFHVEKSKQLRPKVVIVWCRKKYEKLISIFVGRSYYIGIKR